MSATSGLRPRLRAARHVTLIGLLAVTGMRPGEAIGLDRHDVDLRHGTVHVRAGKQKKQREVPLHQSTRLASTPACATRASPSRQPQRSLSPRGDDGWPEGSSTERSSS